MDLSPKQKAAIVNSFTTKWQAAGKPFIVKDIVNEVTAEFAATIPQLKPHHIHELTRSMRPHRVIRFRGGKPIGPLASTSLATPDGQPTLWSITVQGTIEVLVEANDLVDAISKLSGAMLASYSGRVTRAVETQR